VAPEYQFLRQDQHRRAGDTQVRKNEGGGRQGRGCGRPAYPMPVHG
jgi:hypothetical protein